MERKPHILICDDNIAVHKSIGAYLSSEDMTYDSAFDGEEAMHKAKMANHDLILLDIMMPKKFGSEVCKEIRKWSDVPIIMLTAKGEEIDRILGLELGADDYIVKPFSPREVLTRIKTVLRRTKPTSFEQSTALSIGGGTIDIDRYEILVQGKKIDATPKEIQILYLLAQNAGRVMTREKILEAVWGYDYYGDTRVVDTQIKRIRKKLPNSGIHFSITPIYGVGYKFEVEE